MKLMRVVVAAAGFGMVALAGAPSVKADVKAMSETELQAVSGGSKSACNTWVPAGGPSEGPCINTTTGSYVTHQYGYYTCGSSWNPFASCDNNLTLTTSENWIWDVGCGEGGTGARGSVVVTGTAKGCSG